MTPASGQVLHDRWRLMWPLQHDRHSTTWLALDNTRGDHVEVRVIPAPENSVAVARFLREMSIAARIIELSQQPELPRIVDVRAEQNHLLVVTEYFDGTSLSSRDDDDAEGVRSRMRSIAERLLDGLAALHRLHAAHGAVAPDVILVAARADGTVDLRLKDAGLRKQLQSLHAPDEEGSLDDASERYRSPEQLLGSRAVDHARADLFSAGVVLWEVAAGQPAWSDAHTPLELAVTKMSKPLPPLPAHVPKDLRDLIAACCALDPAARPATALAARSMLVP